MYHLLTISCEKKQYICKKKHRKMDEVKLALELSKVAHNECKDVPHDIGLRLLKVVKQHLNLRSVKNNVCEICNQPLTSEEIKTGHCFNCKEQEL
jgi:hypothetical protein